MMRRLQLFSVNLFMCSNKEPAITQFYVPKWKGGAKYLNLEDVLNVHNYLRFFVGVWTIDFDYL